MTDRMILVGFIVVLALVIVIAIRFVIRWRRVERQRAVEMQELAARTGWIFSAEDQGMLPGTEDFYLFARGRSRDLHRVMVAPDGPPSAAVFDYSYIVQDTDSHATLLATAAYVRDEAMDLPHFMLRPENVLHRVAGALGMQDIDVDDRPVFSRLFLLRGEDEAAIRAAFSAQVTEIFERHPGFRAEGRGDRLVWWRDGYAAMDQVERLMADAVELGRAFAAARVEG